MRVTGTQYSDNFFFSKMFHQNNNSSRKKQRMLLFLVTIGAVALLVVDELSFTNLSRRLNQRDNASDILQEDETNVLGSVDNILRSLTKNDLRSLSINLGNGDCEWTSPTFDVPENITFTKTLIAGYPSGDKRLAFVQMEALTGLSARDEWDFAFLVSIVNDSCRLA